MRTSLESEIALLRKAGIRATAQRVHVLETLARLPHPISVDRLVEAGKGAFDTTTAYRTLEVLREHGLVTKIDLGQNRSLYERATDHHHHVVCTSCGAIQDVSMCMPSGLSEHVRKATRFAQIDTHALEFFGLCNRCAR